MEKNINKKDNLHLVVTNYWYDEIISGRKRFEYRMITPSWVNRLSGRNYKTITFSRGYTKEKAIFACGEIVTKTIKHEFFGNEVVPVFEIEIKQRID
jgi:hypothetical protein